MNNRARIYFAATSIWLLISPPALAFGSSRNTELICKLAAKVNAADLSFWDPRLQRRFYKDMVDLGHSTPMVSGYFSYLKVDMGKRCPQVW